MILDRFRLDGRVAIVTGAGKGIGAGIAVGLAEAGADVVCAARTEADIDATAAAVGARGRRGLAVRTDVTVTDDLHRLVDTTIRELGRIDILVNNAGGWLPRPVLETSERAFEAALRFNVTTAFLLTQAARAAPRRATEKAPSSTSRRVRRAWCSRCSSRTRPRRPHCR